jgi:hypothetical protein
MWFTARKLREQAKSALHAFFCVGQRCGWDILPRHFYSSIPDLRELRQTETWMHACTMIGVNGADVDSQMQFLRECCLPSLGTRFRQGQIHEHACRENGDSGYGSVESDLLFCFIVTKRPKRVIQVGCGVSTAVLLLAAKEAQYEPQVTCIDPYPTPYVRALAGRKVITLIRDKAQEADIRLFTQLEAGDLLFVDSTHAVRPGSEVNRIVLEVLPRIQSGCFVHFHDIYFPYDYQSGILTTLFFSGESTLLHAFLIHNARYSIAVSLSMLHHACPQQLQLVLPNYRPARMRHGAHLQGGDEGHFPSSIYLKVL